MNLFQASEYAKCANSPAYYLNTYGHVFSAAEQKIDKMECYDYQEDCLDDFEKYRNNIVLKSRQCIPENTFVDTPDGPKSIQNFKVGDLVYSYNLETSQVEMDTVADAWCSGDKQCIKIKLKDSRNVEVGENHPFWIINKQQWVKAKELEINDEILDANIGFGDISVNENEIKLLGYLITDGCTNKQVKFTNNSLDYLDEFEESINNLFPSLDIRKSPKNNGFDYYPHQKHGANTVNVIMEWCESKGIANKKTEFKNLPEEVFYWNKKSIALLINRIFAGDGWISILKKTDNKRLEIGLGSPSIIFLEQIKSLLKKFQIKGNIYEVKNMKLQKNKFYKFRITHSKSITKFINQIGIYKKIKPEHIEIINNKKHDVKNTSFVRKIEKTEIKKCYDISVTKNENFLINGLLVHNTGLSVISAGYVAWRLIFNYDEKILIIANKGDGAVRFLKSVRTFLDYTPKWLLPEGRPIDNQKFIQFSNGSYAEAKASSPEAGRGDSLTLLVLDETAFIEHAEKIWMAASMALSQTGGKCIMISTPNGTGNLYHKTWVNGTKGENDFYPTKVHWSQNPISSKGIIWKTDDSGNKYPWSPWYEEQCRKLQGDKVKIAQELDLSFEGSKLLAIETDLLMKYENRIKNSNTTHSYFDFDFKIKGSSDKPNVDAGKFVDYVTKFLVWKKPERGKKYIVGCDVARGDGDDYSTIQILDAATVEQVAEFQGRIPPDLFAYLIYSVCKHYNEAYLVVEANSFGLATCLDLRNKMNYSNMFMSKSVQDIHVKLYDYKIGEGESIPGFQTSRVTRPLVVTSIVEFLREGEMILHSPRLMEEFKTFVMKNGKPEHDTGFNDDLIFALGLALYIRSTEYNNVMMSKGTFRGMLDAIAFSSDNIEGKVFIKKKEDLGNSEGGKPFDSKGAGGLYLNTDSLGTDEDDDDLSWLVG